MRLAYEAVGALWMLAGCAAAVVGWRQNKQLTSNYVRYGELGAAYSWGVLAVFGVMIALVAATVLVVNLAGG